MRFATVLIVAGSLMSGCGSSSVLPLAPDSFDFLGALAGSWRSLNPAADQCAACSLDVRPSLSGTADVTFSVECANGSVSSRGVGAMAADVLTWTNDYVASLTLSAGTDVAGCGSTRVVSSSARSIDTTSVLLSYSVTSCGRLFEGVATLSKTT